MQVPVILSSMLAAAITMGAAQNPNWDFDREARAWAKAKRKAEHARQKVERKTDQEWRKAEHKWLQAERKADRTWRKTLILPAQGFRPPCFGQTATVEPVIALPEE